MIKATASVELAAAAKDLWPLLVDTDRVNRLIGMAPVKYHPVPEGTHEAARFLADTRMGGFSVTYEEFPYEWEHPKRFGVYRKFLRGPLEWMRMRWTLEPTSTGGTKLDVTFEAETTTFLLRPVAAIGGRRAVNGMVDLARKMDAHVRLDAPTPFSQPVGDTHPSELAAALRRLKEKVRPALAERIATYVESSPDADAIRMRPFDLADEWKEPRREVLEAMLYGVPAGLVELRWAIICPSCRTASEEAVGLDEIGKEGHCQLCDIAFELELDKAVEATFRPHETIRRVPAQFFCMGGPARTPHVHTQLVVPSGEEVTFAAPDEPGRYRLFARGGARATLEVADGGAEKASVRAGADAVDPADLRVKPGAPMTVRNDTGDERHIKVERLAWASAAATAYELSTLPTFRTLFSSDLLKRETPLRVARCAILFSDLTGSTALYSEVGEAAAFRLVDDHFDVLRDVVAHAGGAVVKTMGDAVMASFIDEKSCIEAAIDCLIRFETFREKTPHGARTHIKLGLYSGSCYVITANEALDYFGQTVNVASRLQHLAESGEIVVTTSAFEAVAKNDERVTASAPTSVKVKGVDHAIDIVRLRLRKPH